MVPVLEFLTVGWILSHFGTSRSAALAGYRAFVKEGLESRPGRSQRVRFISEAKTSLKNMLTKPDLY
jgi:hypothetical protein